jgi:hypothetical protein
MAIDANKQRVIMAWLTKLSHVMPMLKKEGWSAAKETAILATYADMLYADFTSSAAIFTDASGAAIAGQNPAFPSYDVLRAQLNAWWDEHRPRAPATGVAGTEHLSEMDRTSIKLWTEMLLAGATHEKLAIRLGVLRRYVETAYQWLIANEPLAMSLARQHHWEAPVRTGEDFTEAGTREILAALVDHPMQRTMLSAYRTLLGTRAPQFLPIVDEWEAAQGLPAAAGPTPGQSPEAEAAPAFKPKPVAGAVLAEMRKAAGIHLPDPKPQDATPC